MAVYGFQRDFHSFAALPHIVDHGAGGGFVAQLQRLPQAQGFHVLPKGCGGAIAQREFGGVHHRVVKAVVEKHIAQIVHINQGGCAAVDALGI